MTLAYALPKTGHPNCRRPDKVIDAGHSVYSCKPNAWGLYHMHANVPEWVQDHWHHDYTNAPSDGSAWLSEESDCRVVRGGDWQYGAEMRSAFRIGCHHDNEKRKRIGFRLAHD